MISRSLFSFSFLKIAALAAVVACLGAAPSVSALTLNSAPTGSSAIRAHASHHRSVAKKHKKKKHHRAH